MSLRWSGAGLVFLLPLWAAPVQAQFAPGEAPATADVLRSDPLDSQARARARFEATRTTPRDLTRAQLETTYTACDSRLKEFLAGRTTLEFLLESCLRFLESQLAWSRFETDDAALRGQIHLACAERAWELAWIMEEIQKARYADGRVPRQDYLQTRYFRLGLDKRLVEARASAKPGKHLAPRGIDLLSFTEVSPLDRKDLARAKFEALGGTPSALDRAQREAILGVVYERFAEFLAGRGTLDFMLDAERRLLALAKGATAQRAASQRYWFHAREADVINQARYEGGRIPIQDYADTRYERLEAEIWLTRFGPAKDGNRVPGAVALGPFFSPFYPRALWEATHSVPRRLLMDQLAAAQSAYDSRAKEFLAGRGTLTFLLTSAERMVQTEQALASRTANHLAALERHFDRMNEIEEVNRSRYDEGRIPIQDHMQSRAARLQAALRLLAARTLEKKP